MNTGSNHAIPNKWQSPLDAPLGTQLLLLTTGGVPVIGKWARSGHYISWAPLPKKSNFYDPKNTPPPSGTLLVLNGGGVPIISSWRDNYGFSAWHPLPKKEEL